MRRINKDFAKEEELKARKKDILESISKGLNELEFLKNGFNSNQISETIAIYNKLLEKLIIELNTILADLYKIYHGEEI
jgi:hypothetical protein